MIEELAELEPDIVKHSADQIPQKPEEAFVPPGAEFAWAAFWCLHLRDRPYVTVGFAVPMGATIIEPRALRIPSAAIDLYARRHGIAGSARDIFDALIDACDAEYMAVEAERARDRAARRG